MWIISKLFLKFMINYYTKQLKKIVLDKKFMKIKKYLYKVV